MPHECRLEEGTSALKVRFQDLFGVVHQEQIPRFQFHVEVIPLGLLRHLQNQSDSHHLKV